MSPVYTKSNAIFLYITESLSILYKGNYEDCWESKICLCLVHRGVWVVAWSFHSCAQHESDRMVERSFSLFLRQYCCSKWQKSHQLQSTYCYSFSMDKELYSSSHHELCAVSGKNIMNDSRLLLENNAICFRMEGLTYIMKEVEGYMLWQMN